MCLAIPGRIVAIEGTDPDGRVARVDYGIAVKVARLLYLPEAEVGDYIIVQAGFAITRVTEEEARQALEYARQADEATAAAGAPPSASRSPA